MFRTVVFHSSIPPYLVPFYLFVHSFSVPLLASLLSYVYCCPSCVASAVSSHDDDDVDDDNGGDAGDDGDGNNDDDSGARAWASLSVLLLAAFRL